MSLQELPPIFPLLVICLLKECFCICDGTIWAKVGWEIFPEEMHYLKAKPPPSRCLPYPINKLCCNFANMDIFQGFLYLMYILGQAVFLILAALSVHYLWMKWKKHKRKLKKQASLDTAGNELESQSISDVDRLLCKLLATTSMMTAYLNQTSRHPTAKKLRHRKLQRKNRQGARGRHRHPPMNVAQASVEATQEVY
ncbi:testis-expressed protein 50 [Pteronotus mesoamericanus]|uniref:testis-expressed protein 50 n=1 Tax=Pteronotus mesoamericanus TaxID=1884717 RepID=UPI0023EBE073|nr:testis-expressed protein 50 [Pteronotus parnellii mesoamericanus]